MEEENKNGDTDWIHRNDDYQNKQKWSEYWANGDILKKNDEDLLSYIKMLSNYQTGDDSVYILSILRASIVNSVLNRRFLESIERENNKSKKLTTALASLAISVSLIQILVSLNS